MLSLIGFIFMASGFGGAYFYRNSPKKARSIGGIIVNGGVLVYWTYLLLVEWPLTKAYKYGEGVIPTFGFYGVSIVLYGLTVYFFVSKNGKKLRSKASFWPFLDIIMLINLVSTMKSITLIIIISPNNGLIY